MDVKTEIRLVAIIWPESSWGVQTNPEDSPKLQRAVQQTTHFPFAM